VAIGERGGVGLITTVMAPVEVEGELDPTPLVATTLKV
jgi:hypothetical protein